MPMSIDPQPEEDEIECAHCGAHIYYELTRCPNCGVNLYEPDDESGEDRVGQTSPANALKGLLARLDEWIHALTRRSYPVDELFGTAINQAELYDNLLLKVGGDRPTVERLIEYERQKLPQQNRMVWLENAIRRWEQDNRGVGVK
jgi:predicted  nucleic acid-binding Zn-ribbon protein